ncbi:hypothetical protein ATO2_15535 [Roseovarius sp. 22II1-1F6A]|nr:hypothetical protein ATO2_15535 [Roseovarius sp. 22II1-1F6A]
MVIGSSFRDRRDAAKRALRKARRNAYIEPYGHVPEIPGAFRSCCCPRGGAGGSVGGADRAYVPCSPIERRCRAGPGHRWGCARWGCARPAAAAGRCDGRPRCRHRRWPGRRGRRRHRCRPHRDRHRGRSRGFRTGPRQRCAAAGCGGCGD